MFQRNSPLGVILDNFRSLSISLLFISLFTHLIALEAFIMLIAIAIGTYYGYMIESQVDEFRRLGGRVLRGRNWDYLMISKTGL
jgi:hypothetical protein